MGSLDPSQVPNLSGVAVRMAYSDSQGTIGISQMTDGAFTHGKDPVTAVEVADVHGTVDPVAEDGVVVVEALGDAEAWVSIAQDVSSSAGLTEGDDPGSAYRLSEECHGALMVLLERCYG